jgi:ribosomal protein L23
MQFIADNEEIIKRTAESKILFEILSINLLNILANNPSAKKNCNQPDASDIEIIWQNFKNELYNNRPRLASLLESATISELNPNSYCIIVNRESSKDDIESEKSEIERVFGSLLNQSIKISVVYKVEEKLIKHNPGVKDKISKVEIQDNNESKPNTESETKSSINSDDVFTKFFPSGKKIK